MGLISHPKRRFSKIESRIIKVLENRSEQTGRFRWIVNIQTATKLRSKNNIINNSYGRIER